MKKYIIDNFYFLAGMISLMLANVPNIYSALNTGQTAPLGFLVLLQMGLTFYLLDAIVAKRPKIFVVSGVINTSLNLIPLMIAVGA